MILSDTTSGVIQWIQPVFVLSVLHSDNIKVLDLTVLLNPLSICCTILLCLVMKALLSSICNIYFEVICSHLWFVEILSLYLIDWFHLQSWRWKVLEACVFASALPHWSNNLWLVWHSLAKELLQLWVWPFQHILQKNWNMGSHWLPLRKCWSICFRGLDTSRSYPPGVDQVEQPLAYVS